jgi:hypothetical protein
VPAEPFCDCADEWLELLASLLGVELCAKISAAARTAMAAKYVRPFMRTLRLPHYW